MGANLHGRTTDRKKRRMPCRFELGATRHNGLIVDLSRSGMFVQTAARAKPNEVIELALSDNAGEELKLRVEVVRRKSVPPRLLSVAQGGMGVRILEAPDSYRAMLRELGIPDDAPCVLEPLKRFGILIRQIPGSRSKRLQIEAEDEEAAVEYALEKVGEGWKVQQVDALD